MFVCFQICTRKDFCKAELLNGTENQDCLQDSLYCRKFCDIHLQIELGIVCVKAETDTMSKYEETREKESGLDQLMLLGFWTTRYCSRAS